jgi:hypothetical protein
VYAGRVKHPVHPSGFPRADDAPAFVKPPLDLRAAVEALAGADEHVDRAVAFTLAFPIVEAPRTLPPPAPEVRTSAPPPSRGASESTAPYGFGEQFEPDATLVDLPRVEETTLQGDYYKSGEVTLAESDRDGLARSLPMLGPFDNEPDLDTERAADVRVLLARARAIRFRIAILDLRPGEPDLVDDLPDAADAALHAATTVALADGLPAEVDGRGEADDAIVHAILLDLQARFPTLGVATVREAGAAAFARVTLLGTRKAARYVGTRWADSPVFERRAALALARRVVGDDVGHRSVAMQLLREALHL